MKRWLLFALFVTPLAASAAATLAPPQIQAPTPEATAEVVKAPILQDPTPVATAEATARVKVYTRVPHDAFVASLWPGVLLHGWGHHVAGDQDTFLNLAGGELFGSVMLAFGLNEALGPDIKDESKATSQAIAIGGGVIFGVTWLWDMVDAGSAAKRFNKEHNLSLLPMGDGAQLALTLRY